MGKRQGLINYYGLLVRELTLTIAHRVYGKEGANALELAVSVGLWVVDRLRAAWLFRRNWLVIQAGDRI